ncbi:alkaline phosphatase family protein [Dyadobacter psychrophilus]|uniref:Predicted pyrophosphatase or phosphodiesterase, AlkP superfamily n=1 Tax=Dyadobacter psychrophilus TaxID=651661 RepID=A0A1T5EF73_9BACT|nr:ectonucleotide pyrophosphatase/phosphodiesterase [Dyadobacter psychrophilus]SKB82468.1 Predicted pyrophosphatase or phosphodiesterase, AlkP superfamily [Dyadobacter psychrophilus]
MKIRSAAGILVGTFVLLITHAFGQHNAATPSLAVRNKTLIVFFDGLRPDYITSEQMPNLFAFRQKASVGKHHHSVFPTVTRVNSASYATGSYPGTHGILGNAVYFPEVNKTKSIGTSHKDLSKFIAANSEPLLSAVTLGEVLQSAGERMMVFSSGTTGQAFLQNYKVSGGAIINPGLILPDSMKSLVLADLGEVSKEGSEDQNRHKWVTDALLKYSLDIKAPLVSAIWFSDPDGAAHEHGIGSEEAVSAIKFVDAQFGRILEAIESRGLKEQYNIIISTDHGFVTNVGQQDLSDFLIKEGLKKDKESDDVILAEGSVYVKDHDPEKIEKIVTALHKQEWVGAVFTKARTEKSLKGWVEGTFSFDAVHFNHKRAGDILVAPNWNDEKNAKGFAGTDFSTGVAGHGGSSPYEIHIELMAAGPDFKRLKDTDLPTSNVDIVPTILAIYGLPIPPQMDGRVISEILKKPGDSGGKMIQETLVSEVKYPWGVYRLTVYISVLGKYRYFTFSKTERR